MDEREKAVETEKAAEKRHEEKVTQRQMNLDAKLHYPKDSFFKTLDSSVKKNSVFVKKLSTITEANRAKLTQDLNSLNLTKYIEEVVAAICTARLKMQDMNCAIHLCSLLHRRYSDFSTLLLKNLQQSLANFGTKEDKVSRMRIELRLLGQCLVLGIVTDQKEGFTLLHNTINHIVHNDKEKLEYLPAIVSFVKHCGEDILGVMSAKNKELQEEYSVKLPLMKFLGKEKQQIFADLVREYCATVIISLIRMHGRLLKILKSNKKTLYMKGEVSAEKIEIAEKLSAQHSKLTMNATTLADLLCETLPDLPSLHNLDEDDADQSGANTNASDMGEGHLWEDEDQKTFYRDILDLTGIVPQILYKRDSSKDGKEEKKEEKKVEEKVEEKKIVDLEEGKDEEEITEEKIEEEFNKLAIKEEEEDDEEEEEIVVTQNSTQDNNSSSLVMTVSNKALMDTFINRLSTISNRDLVNEVAQEFCLSLNTKTNRKKLVRALYGVPRSRLDLLPFHARLVRTLSPILPDVPADLFTLLKKEFLYHLRKKDQNNLETKVKNIRFIGELCKFETVEKAEALWCLRVLLEQFTHHNIEIACNLLECCGRYLFRSPDTHLKTNHLLDQMMRKKVVHNLDPRQITMVENAYYYCNPPERVAYTKKIRPPLHDYIRKLLFIELNKHSVEKVLRQFRKLPWSNEEVARYAMKSLCKVWMVKFHNIYCVANLLSGLAQFQERVGITVVENVLEAIRVGMEINQPQYNQRRVAEAKLLGELYNYRMIESNIIFNTLYLVISFGSLPDGTNPIDPPTDTIRIRLVLTIMDTCGQYFEKGNLKKKCDTFLLFFQKYLFTKVQPLPIDVDYSIQDTMEAIRPHMTLHSTVVEVDEAIAEISPQLRHVLGSQEVDDDEDDEEDEDTETEDAAEDGSSPAEDEEVKVKKLEVHKCEEDEEFLKELEKTMTAELSDRKTNMRVGSSDLALPMNRGFKGPKIDGNKMQFSVLLKKGSKQQFKPMGIPLESDFASNLYDKQKAVLKEKEELKRLVLSQEQRQEEEELLAEELEFGTGGGSAKHSWGYTARPAERKQRPRKAPQLTTEMFNFSR